MAVYEDEFCHVNFGITCFGSSGFQCPRVSLMDIGLLENTSVKWEARTHFLSHILNYQSLPFLVFDTLRLSPTLPLISCVASQGFFTSLGFGSLIWRHCFIKTTHSLSQIALKVLSEK